MKKVKIFLTLLTIAITVTPIVIELLIYHDNLLNLVIPPEITDLFNGNNDNSNSNVNRNFIDSLLNSEFELPQLVGEPQYDPETKTLTATFSFTNPLQTPISVDRLSSGILSHNDGVFLGNLTIDNPININPGQTAQITAKALLSDESVNYLKAKSENQNSINIDLIDLNVDSAGVNVQLEKQNIGDIPFPPEILSD
jgi:hypothetical protein